MPGGHPDALRDGSTERAELGDEAGSLCPVEDVVLEVGDEYGMAPAERSVGVRSESGGPAGAVRVEAEEVRGRIGVSWADELPLTKATPGRRLAKSCSARPWFPPSGPIRTSDADFVDEPSRLGERRGGRRVGTAEDEPDRMAADRDALDAVRQSRPAALAAALEQSEVGTGEGGSRG